MKTAAPAVRELPDLFRAKADDLEPYSRGGAVAWRAAAAAVEAALVAQDGELLTLEQAAKESGLSSDHLRHLIAGGTIPNAGVKGRPRLLRAHLPKKTKASAAAAPPEYDATAEAISIESRRLSKRMERAQ